METKFIADRYKAVEQHYREDIYQLSKYLAEKYDLGRDAKLIHAWFEGDNTFFLVSDREFKSFKNVSISKRITYEVKEKINENSYVVSFYDREELEELNKKYPVISEMAVI